MQFKFDANQEFQVKAVESVVNLLEGQQRISGTFWRRSEGRSPEESHGNPAGDIRPTSLEPDSSLRYAPFRMTAKCEQPDLLSEIFPGTIANSLTLTEDDLLANLNKVQLANSLKPGHHTCSYR